MNIDATEEDLRTAAEALKLAAILDDRAPKADKARIAAWAEKLHAHRLGRTDVLDGLQAFYDHPSERAIAIGDLIAHARAARRDRAEREENTHWQTHYQYRDQQAIDDLRELSADFLTGRVNDTPRLKAARNLVYTCRTRTEAIEAIREFFAAKQQARKREAS